MKKSGAISVSLAAFLTAASLQYMPESITVNAAGAEVKISEVCSQNKSCLTDSYGKHSDWIEIWNTGSTAADISGYGLSDREDSPMKWTFPAGTSVPAGGYLVVFASENESVSGELHTGFSLSKNGETLVLSSASGDLVQKVEIPVLGEDVSYGCSPDGGSAMEIMSPTPGKKNEAVVSAPSFSKASGFYGTDFALSVTAPAGTTVYYTLDGSDPATSSSAQVYSGPVTVKDRSQEPNIYANYEEGETDISVSRGIGFRKPSFNVDKATVVRAAAKGQDGKFSSTVSATYFITSGKLSQYSDMTVISLVSDPENFFGPEKGIYVTGRQYMNWRQSGDYKPNKSVWDTDNKCNYFSKGSDWEREVTVSLFENGSLSLEQNMGIRIKGASTRNHAQKSFNLFARSEYGASKINLPLIPDNTGYNGKTVDKYDSVSLRSASSEERLRDGFAQKLLKDMDGITTQKMRPCVVFLNGEYWGLYEITEKLSDYFTETHYGVRKQDVAMIKSGEREEGPQEETDNFLQTADRFAAMNLADRSAYSEVCSFIDIDSMIEHYAAGLFLGTYDWPNRNYGVWKSTGEKDPDNKYTDGRWRFITYDLDYTMGQTYENFGGTEGYAYNSFTHMEKGKKDQPTALFLSLLKNDEFRAKFANTYSDLANTVLTYEKAGEMADYYSKNYAGLIADSQVRWWGYFHGNPESYRSQYKSEYQNKILGQIKTFFQQRKSYGMDQMKKYLGLSGQMQTVTVKVSGGGKVKVSSLTADSSSVFTSQYLSDAPVTLTAVPDPGSSFAGWGGDASGIDLTITVPLSKAVNITASFSESTQTGTAGDINRDGKITSADLAELTAYFTGVKNPENISAADMNSDGKVNIADICILKSRLTGQS